MQYNPGTPTRQTGRHPKCTCSIRTTQKQLIRFPAFECHLTWILDRDAGCISRHLNMSIELPTVHPASNRTRRRSNEIVLSKSEASQYQHEISIWDRRHSFSDTFVSASGAGAQAPCPISTAPRYDADRTSPSIPALHLDYVVAAPEPVFVHVDARG